MWGAIRGKVVGYKMDEAKNYLLISIAYPSDKKSVNFAGGVHKISSLESLKSLDTTDS